MAKSVLREAAALCTFALFLCAFPQAAGSGESALAGGHARLAGHRAGTYSDMTRHAGSGDITGCEVRLVIAEGEYAGTMQCAHAWPGPLVRLERVRFEDGALVFTVPRGPEAGHFRGRITRGTLTGRLMRGDGSVMNLVLPRGRSFWDR